MNLKLKLSKSEALKLLLICGLPVHFWAILMIFKEAETLLTKRDLIYGLGFSGYLLGLAIIESLLFFAFVYALTFLFPKNWKSKTPYLAATGIALTIAFWALLNRVFFLLAESSPAWLNWMVLWMNYRKAISQPLIWAAVIISAGLPVLLIPRSVQLRSFMTEMIDKLIMLAPLYLLFDLVGIIFTVARNLT
jgi:hypothetical protein